jgi:Mg/Co/Ni transporter MgtE
VDITRDAARATDAYIHKNPWQAIGVAAGIGLVVGLLTGRRQAFAMAMDTPRDSQGLLASLTALAATLVTWLAAFSISPMADWTF